MIPRSYLAMLGMAMLGLHSLQSNAQDQGVASEKEGARPGHSFHAEAFNEGPRQAAYLMSGMGNVHWPVSTRSPMAQRFFDQGLSQLHGFWYFEAERSFRQAAAMDPDCAIHYWGMARANIENPSRSAGFIEQAMRRIEQAKPVEKRLIEAWSRRVQNWPEDEAKPEDGTKSDAAPIEQKSIGKRAMGPGKEETREKRRQRLRDYVKDLEALALDHPEDVEIKAMLVLQYWQNQGEGIDIQSHAAMDAMLSEIFRINPRHPAHHFRIHLWDYRKEDLALTAAARCGPSAPGIAHMWHMPGHTYSRLHRYADAAWQQEASARVDHAHMIRDGVMPDQIHNFAHNNEWLIRNWLYLGKFDAAIDLAKNMIELPRHPSFNMPDGSGSASYGRQRLLTALATGQRWEEMRELCASIYLDSDDPVMKDEINAWKAIAMVHTGQGDVAQEERGRMLQLRRTLREEIVALEAANASSSPKPPTLSEPGAVPENLLGADNDPALPEKVSKEFDEGKWKDRSPEEQQGEKDKHTRRYRHYRLGIGLAALDAHLAASRQEYRSAVRKSQEARSMVDNLLRIEWCSQANEHALAVNKIREAFDASPGQLLPAALTVWVTQQAVLAVPNAPSLEEWKKLQRSAAERCAALSLGSDPNLAWVARARSIAIEGFPDLEWGTRPKESSDIGDRPPLDSLGPVRWKPPMAPIWSTQLASGEEESSKRRTGKPYVMILYLGFGCLHCAEQLSAFSPMVEKFQESGIDVIGISTETPKSLVEGLSRYEGEMKIPLAANSDLDVFKAFRCFDDFEGQPLHGTILVDAEGRIRWQDIGYEPFMNVDFLLNESRRLLKLN